MRTGRAWIGTLVIAGLWVIGVGCSGDEAQKDPTGTTSSTSSSSTGGTGGAGGTGGMMASSSSTGAGGQGGCTSASQCPGVDSECGVRTCTAGECGMIPLKQAGTIMSSQLYGDCRKAQCDASGGIEQMPDETDKYDDGNSCTVDSCVNGDTLHVNQVAGIACGLANAGKCDGNGQCVRCNVGASDCATNLVCVETARNYKDAATLDGTKNKCVPGTCVNGTKDGTETDVDCGGFACAPCAQPKSCVTKLDCQDVSCDGTIGMKTCVVPTCSDGTLNGSETYPDFGGPDCPPCTSAGWGCKEHSDCVSGVCMNAKCAAPSCTDAVKNGDEQGVDCGGSCPAVCFTP